MRSIRTWLWAVAALASLHAGSASAQVNHRALLDLDSNAATGCTVATPAGNVAGIEVRLTATVTGQPPMVTAVTREQCVGAGFGAPTAQAAGYPVGVNIGTNGADVVEFATSLTGLGSGGPANITFVSQTATGADIVVANGVFLPGQAAVPTQPAVIPATGLLGLLLLVALLLWFVRKHPRFAAPMALLLLLGAGVAWAANFVTDGAIGDWAGVQPRATDANNDATSGEMTIEIVAVFAETEGGNLFLRVDVRDAQNQPPVANAPAAVTLNEDGSVTITLTGTDPEAAPLTFAIATSPTRGTLGAITPVNATSASVLYTATANQNGADSFTFTVNDGSSTSTPATVSITITPVNDAPVVTAATFNVVENSPNGTNVGTPIVATDPDAGQAITWSITAGNALGAFAINPATGQITVADSADVIPGNSPFALTVQATDNGAPVLSGSATVTINVTGVNDEPSFTPGPNQAATEDDPPVTVPNWATAISAGPPDEAGQTLAFTVSNDNNALFSVQPAIAANGTLTYQLAPNANGSATVSVFLQDNGGTVGGGDDTSPTVTFTITVAAVNDTPSFALPAAPNQNVLQDSGAASVPGFATAISAGPSDESAQVLTFNVSNDNNALFQVQPAIAANGTLTFTPAAGAVGTATITVTLSDNGGGAATSAAQTFVINVNLVNQAPSFTATTDPAASNEDGGAQAVAGFVTGISDGDAAVVQVVSFNVTGNTNPALFAAGPAIDAAGQLTYTAAPNAFGTADITFVAQDDGGTANGGVDTSAPDTFTITVNAVNDVPAFTAGPTVNVLQDAGAQTVDPWATGLSAGPANETGQTLTFNITANTNAALFSAGPAVGPTGVLTFTPAAGAVGSASITLAVQDNGGTANGGVDTSATQTFVINVNNVNDPPTFNSPADPAAVLEDAGLQTVAAFITGIDDGDPPVAQNVSFTVTGNTNAALFAVAPAIAADGTLTYTPAPNANGTADITFVAQDDGGTAFGGNDTSAPDTFTITVTAVNDAPAFTAGPNQSVLQDSGAATIDPWATGIGAGPADEAGQTLSFAITANTNAALFSAGPAVSSTGVLTFTPAAGAQGSADITLRIQDNGGTANGGVDSSATQTFTITVNNVNDPPTFMAPADPAAVLEDAAPVSLAGFVTGIDDGDAGVTQNVSFVVTGNTNGALFASGPAISPAGTLTYTLAANANGTADITFVAMDDGGTAFGGNDTSAPDTFTIAATAVNDVPAFTAGPNQTVLENAGAQTVNPWATGLSAGPADEAGQALSFNITANSNAALFSAGPAVSPTGVLTYTPAPGLSGSASITLAVQDNGGTANGGVDTSATQTFTITVDNINSAPVFTVGADQTVNEDAGPQTVNPFATGVDDGDPGITQALTFNVTGNTNAALFSAGPSVSPAGVLTYTPAANASGSATITLTLSDDGGTANGGVDTSAPQNFTITVNAVNDVPSFTAGANQTVLEDAGAQTVDPWATGLSAGPADEAGQTLSFNVTANTNAALFSAGPAISPTGVLTYTPAANVSGTATITVNIQDNGGTANGGVDTSATQSFTITVNGVNDAPVFTPGANQTVDEDAGAQTVNPWATAIDDGDSEVQALTFNILSNSNAALFSAGPAISSTGVLTYTPAANAFGSATLQVQLMDDGGTANGGVNVSGTVNLVITVNPVNDPPVAGDEAFDALGNTELRVDLGTSPTTPFAAEATGGGIGVRGNDMDPVEGHAHSVTSISGCADLTAPYDCTVNGLAISMQANGTFSVVPTGAVATGSPTTVTFDYVLTDQPPVGEGIAANDTGTVTVRVFDKIWYVDAGAPAGGNGTSALPFNSYTGINGAGGAGDGDGPGEIIFIHDDATTLLGSLELEANQRLWGEGFGLSVAVNLNANGSPTNLVAAGTRAAVSGTDAVRVGNALPAEIRGLRLTGTGGGNALDITTNAALTGATTLLIDGNTIEGAAAEGIDVNFNTPTTGRTIAITNNTWTLAGTHTGNAIDINNTTNPTADTLRLNISNNSGIVSAGSGIVVNSGAVSRTTITGFANNSVHGNTGGIGVNLTSVTLEATPGGAFDQVNGGTLAIGQVGNPAGLGGLRIATSQGNLFFTDMDVLTASGIGLLVSNGGAGMTFGVTPASGGGSSTLDNDGGQAVVITGTALDLRLAQLDGTSTAGNVVSLDTVTGQFGALAGTITKSGAGVGYSINASNVVADYAGSLAVTSGAGVGLTGNTGSVITFRGGLSISSGADPAFAATGGGTVHVCDESPCNAAATGALVNTLATTTGTALNVANTNIGANDLEFRSVNVDGNDASPTSAIILTSTGTLGGLNVKGTGAAGSGGTIRDTSGDAIALTTTEKVGLAGMVITSNLGNGIGGTGVHGFVLASSSITANGDDAAQDDSGIDIIGLTGTAAGGSRPTSITNTTISNNHEFELQITNTSGTLTNLQMSGNTLSSDGFQLSHGNLFNFLGLGNAVMTLNLTSGTFTGNTDTTGGKIITATGVQCDHSGTSSLMTCNVSGATFTNNNVGPQSSVSNGGNMQSDFNNVTATGGRAHGENHFVAANYTGTLGATVQNSIIGTLGVAGSGSSLGFGVRLQNEGVATTAAARLRVNGTTVQETASFSLINVNQGITAQTSSTPSDVTITNNTLRNSGARALIVQQNNNTDADSAGDTCANVSGNTSTNIAGQAGDGTHYRFRRLDANNAGDQFLITQTDVNNLAAVNGVAPAQVSVGGTPTFNGGACALP